MKARKQLRHDLAGCDRRDSERLAAIFLDGLPPHDGSDSTRRIRGVLLDLVVQLGHVMQSQQQREHRGELQPPTDWAELDSKIAEQLKM